MNSKPINHKTIFFQISYYTKFTLITRSKTSHKTKSELKITHENSEPLFDKLPKPTH